MTKQPINPITSQISNPFFGKSLKRRIGSPLYTTYKNSINELEERDRRCREEPSSKESRIFGDVFYLNMMRKEFANKKLRSALCTISMSKYFRHDIKKRVKEIQIKHATSAHFAQSPKINKRNNKQNNKQIYARNCL